MQTETILTTLVRASQAHRRCVEANNHEWEAKWDKRITALVSELPRGSGFDSGTQFDADASSSTKAVFTTAFHHMDEGGGYDGWTEHTITATADLESGFRLKISGRDRNGIKEYIGDLFHDILSRPATIGTFAADKA